MCLSLLTYKSGVQLQILSMIQLIMLECTAGVEKVVVFTIYQNIVYNVDGSGGFKNYKTIINVHRSTYIIYIECTIYGKPILALKRRICVHHEVLNKRCNGKSDACKDQRACGLQYNKSET